MTKPTEAFSQPANFRDRIIVALDVDSTDEARAILRELRGHVGAFKIGLQLFASAGPELVREFTNSGVKVFLDFKFHGIPHTLAKALVEAAGDRGLVFNIHKSGGSERNWQNDSEVYRACKAGNNSLTPS